MEFGRVEPYELSGIDFKLPDDPGMTTETLAASKRDGQLKVYVGGTNWANPALVGTIYPPGTMEKDFLGLYTHQFNSIEFGTSFYNIPKPERITEWRCSAEDSPGFKFCPKFPQTITHLRRFKNAEAPTEQFYDWRKRSR